MIYWDTSCVIPLYAAEPDSAAWQRLAAGAGEGLLSSALLAAELAFALERKEIAGHLRTGGSARLQAQFARDVKRGRIRLVPIGSDVLARAGQIAAECLRAPRPVLLRTLDGIHLATAMVLRCSTLATADERMRKAAAHLGLRLVEMETA